jgi:hypothetical protein
MIPLRALALAVAACAAAAPAVAAGAPPPAPSGPALLLSWDAGPAAVLTNRLRFGAQGTTYERADVNQDNLYPAQRITAELRLAPRHRLALSYLPLSLVTSARLPRDVRFEDEAFPAGTPVESTYRFDGWRATYLWRAVERGRLSWDVGGALQIRAAFVELAARDGSRFARTSNVGPVPALSTRLTWSFSPGGAWTRLDATGLWSPAGQGGLYDAAWTIGAPVALRGAVQAYAGLRFYGGGADVPDTYNFADFAFALAGVQLDLGALR